jgi:hypothetical protein
VSLIGKLIVAVVILFAACVLFLNCDHRTWRNESSKRFGPRWRCMDCGALTDEEPT